MLPSGRDRHSPQGPPAVLYLNDGQNLFDPVPGVRRQHLACGRDRELAGRRTAHPADPRRRHRPRRSAARPRVSARRGRAQSVTPVVRSAGSTWSSSRVKSCRSSNGRIRSRGARRRGRSAGRRTGRSRRCSPCSSGRACSADLLLESPSLYVGNRFLLRKARRAPRWPARVYLGVGTAETSKADVNRETVENVRVLESILQGAGLGAKRLKLVVQEGATHSEGAWAGRLGAALTFLFGR